MPDDIADFGKPLLLLVYVLTAAWITGHALLHKREPRSALGWMMLAWMLPLLGALLYFWLGVNRLERRAQRELGIAPLREVPPSEPLPDVPGAPVEVRELLRLGRILTGRPLAPGNRVTPLHGGEQAYPDMLGAIERARKTVWLETYIFDHGEAAKAFALALGEAQRRGVQVRVLLDGVGTLTVHGRGIRLLHAQDITTAKFLPLRLFPPMLHANLRNHHKLLVVDGAVAWTGGMNVSDSHYVERGGMADLQFRMEGPVVAQLEGVFIDGWRFASGEKLAPTEPPPAAGEVACRVVTDGPNDAVDRLQLILLAAIANAHKRVCIMTPYFIPTPELSGALQAAALRGLSIEIVLPRKSDQFWVDAATRRWLTQLVGRAVKVHYRADRAHTKLFLMDGYYALVGSANMDPRSLRLNFELDVELYDTGTVGKLQRHFDEVRARSTEVTEAMLSRRPLWGRLADAAMWLFSPYL